MDPADLDLSRWLRPGDCVLWSQACAEPTPLLHALLDQAPTIGGLRAFAGMSLDRRLADGPHEGLEVRSWGALGTLAQLADRGGLHVVPEHFSTLPGRFARREIPIDVALVQVSPPDADGMCSLGIGVDYTADALPHARTVIAEVNTQMPATAGGPRLPRDGFAATVETDRPLTVVEPSPIGDVERLIAGHVAGLVADGDTIQTGVGALPAAMLEQLKGHRDLGVHSGMITDGVVDLIEAGVVTGARKPTDTGLVVTGIALGSRRLYDAVGADGPIRFAPASSTHAPEVLAAVGPLVALNGALEVDLTGQVNAEVADGRHRGAAGGQVDFCRAASRGSGRSVIALRSCARDGRSRIVASLSGPVTTPRTDVEFVVTEHGVADLRGKDLAARASAMVAVAAPEHREALQRATVT